MPFTSHVTAVFEQPDTVAVNCTWPPKPTVALVGEIVIVTIVVVLELPPPHATLPTTTSAQTSRKAKPRMEGLLKTKLGKRYCLKLELELLHCSPFALCAAAPLGVRPRTVNGFVGL